MLTVLAPQWMNGTWYPPIPGPVSPVLRDINGVQVSVGDTVSVICTIGSLNPINLYNGYATITPIHPFPGLSTLQVLTTACIKQ